MKDALRARLRDDKAIYEKLIDQNEAGLWKSKTMQNGRLVDTNDETLERMKTTLTSIEADLEDLNG